MGSGVVQIESLGRAPVAIGFKGSQTISDPVDLEGYDLVALYLPPDWVTGNITFLAAHRRVTDIPFTDKNPTPPGASDFSDFLPVFDQASNAPTITAAAASRVYHLNPALAANLRGLRYIKIVSSATQNAPFTIYGIVSQGAR